MLRLGDGLILLPERKRFDQLSEKISATLTTARVTPEAVLATLPETREQLYQLRYGTQALSNRVR